ncbi:MAG: D-aminoacylase, partial [Gemmatimonadales bacterium]
MRRALIVGFTAAVALACGPDYDVVIRGGTIYDGSGGAAFVGDLAIKDDTIAVVGGDVVGSAGIEIDASGKAIAPGF